MWTLLLRLGVAFQLLPVPPKLLLLGHPYIRWIVDSLIDLKGVYSQERNLCHFTGELWDNARL